MYTDPTRIHATDPGHVEANPVFEYHEIFNPDRNQVREFKERYRARKIGDVRVKQRLAEVLNDYLAPLRKRRAEYISRPADLIDILSTGTEKARLIARETLEEVEHKMGVR
jgi:tryptophanyl-tRNA synthetase